MMTDNLTLILMHYVFGRDGTVTHFMHHHEDLEGVYFLLPNLYCISVLAAFPEGKQVVGGLFVKTDNHHKDSDFIGVMVDAANSCQALSSLMNSAVSIAPSLLGTKEQFIPDEKDMLRIALEQFMRRSSTGSV